MVNVISGDLIQLAKAGEFDVIVHGCNCQCRMGSGIALQIKEHFPANWEVDQDTIPGDKTKLGTYTHVDYDIETSKGPMVLTVVNMYTQFNYGKAAKQGHVYFDYNAFREALDVLAIEYHGLHVGFPRIGSGLAGGDPDKIERILEDYTDALDITIVDYVA